MVYFWNGATTWMLNEWNEIGEETANCYAMRCVCENEATLLQMKKDARTTINLVVVEVFFR